MAEGQERPRAGPLHQGRLVARSGRVPQAGGLADAQHAAPAEESGAGRVQHFRVGKDGPDLAHLEAGACGVVEVAVGGGDLPEKLPGALRPRPGWHDGDDLELGVEGGAGDLLAYQDGVLDALAGLLPAVPCPAADGQPQGRAGPQERRLPYLPVLHPQVALQGRKRAQAEDGHRHAVHLQGLGLEGVGGLPGLHAGLLVCLVHVGLRPVGAEGAQQQPRHHALPLVEGRERPHEGDEGVGAGVEQVVVPEGSEGEVLGAVRPQGHAPRLLPLARAQGVVVGANLLDAGLGVVGGELAAHHLVVEAAGHQGHAVHVPGQLQGEGFRNGDGLEEVLDAQQGALAGPWRRHRQQDGAFLVFVAAKQDVLRVQLHRGLVLSLMASGCPLNDRRLLRGGLDADGEAVALCQQQPVSPGARQEPSL